MAEQYIIQAETLTKMADALRTITGELDASFTPAEMVKVVSHLYADILYGDEIAATVDNAGYLVINSGDAPNVDFAAVYGLVGTWVQGGTGKGVPIYAMTADGDAVAVQIGGSGSSYETAIVNGPSFLSITKNSVRYFIDPNCLIASSATTHAFRVRLVYSSASASDGVELPELSNEGAASELFAGKELIDGEGNVVTGTFTIDNELSAQDALISQIQTALAGKTAGETGEDVTTETNAYTAKISSLETAVTALETELSGKASGGSGGSMTACEVNVNWPTRYAYPEWIVYTSVNENGNAEAKVRRDGINYGFDDYNAYMIDVLPGTSLTLQMTEPVHHTVDNGELIWSFNGSYVFRIDGACTIDLVPIA